MTAGTGRYPKQASRSQAKKMPSVTRAQFLRGDWQERSLPPSRDTVARIGPGCLARRDVLCRACGEACATGAIAFPPALGRAPLPRIDDDACTGCGECLATCPAAALMLRQRPAQEIP